MRLWCYSCGKSVSNEVPDATVVRALLECPECIEKRSSLSDIAPRLQVTAVLPAERPSPAMWVLPLVPNTGGVVKAYFYTPDEAERVRAWLEEAVRVAGAK